MNDVQKKSLELIEKHIDNLNNEDFLKKYLEIESSDEYLGITIEEFLSNNFNGI
jgi:hypothetical protein